MRLRLRATKPEALPARDAIPEKTLGVSPLAGLPLI